MNCFEPGEVLLLPKEGGTEGLAAALGRAAETGGEVNIISSTEDMLRHYLDNQSLPESSDGIPMGHDWRERFQAFPFVIRVPEGQERERASLLRSVPEIDVALPNYFVNAAVPPQPLASQHVGTTPLPTFNEGVLRQIEAMLNAEMQAPQCGTGVTVAVLDTGVSPAALHHPTSLHPVQFVTDSPTITASNPPPYDPDGHGSTVAHIINRIAPGATIFSVKCLENGNVGALISAFYLAEAAFQPDIYNMSLGIGCDLDTCNSCGHPLGNEAAVTAAQLQLLFEAVDQQRRRSGTPPLLIAAAGNNSEALKMPASFPNVLAVGSYDMVANSLAPYARYRSIPVERFVLAPGGLSAAGQCLGHTGSSPTRRSEALYGTSFSAAFVSAVAARYLCAVKPNTSCSILHRIGSSPSPSIRDYLLESLVETAQFPMPDYSPHQHGAGVIRYELGVIANHAVHQGSVRAKFIVEGVKVGAGQILHLLGNESSLGNWQLPAAIPMIQVTSDVWQVSVDDLQPGTRIEYKFVAIGTSQTVWEPGPNRTFDIPNDRQWCCIVGQFLTDGQAH